MQKILEKNGEIQGTIHRYLIVAEKQLSDSRSQQEREKYFPNNMKYSDGTYADAYWMMKCL